MNHMVGSGMFRCFSIRFIETRGLELVSDVSKHVCLCNVDNDRKRWKSIPSRQQLQLFPREEFERFQLYIPFLHSRCVLLPLCLVVELCQQVCWASSQASATRPMKTRDCLLHKSSLQVIPVSYRCSYQPHQCLIVVIPVPNSTCDDESM